MIHEIKYKMKETITSVLDLFPSVKYHLDQNYPNGNSAWSLSFGDGVRGGNGRFSTYLDTLSKISKELECLPGITWIGFENLKSDFKTDLYSIRLFVQLRK